MPSKRTAEKAVFDGEIREVNPTCAVHGSGFLWEGVPFFDGLFFLTRIILPVILGENEGVVGAARRNKSTSWPFGSGLF